MTHSKNHQTLVVPTLRSPTIVWRDGFAADTRHLPEETPVAFSYNRLTHAVMMATPVDLEDFALGFSRSEGVIVRPTDIEEMQVVPTASGAECRMWIRPELLARLEQRRRLLAGPTGCGLCGLESLAEAVRPPPSVSTGITVDPDDIRSALLALPEWQPLNAQTRAVHAAGFWCPTNGLVTVREDVGRHNALDKLSGALFRAGVDAAAGMVVMTSRISVELVQKAAVAGVTLLVAVSAPTQLALRTADLAGMTLVGIARHDGFEVFTHPHRVRGAVLLGR